MIAALFTAWGFVTGSFLNVVIYRMPRGFLLALPRRSTCLACFRRIPWYENVPVVSYLFLQGACARCRAPIGVGHALIEALTGALFLAVFLRWGISGNTLLYCFFAAALVAMTFIDLEHRIIPDEISLGGAAVALALAALGYGPGLAGAIAGVLLGSGLFWGLAWAYERFTGREGLGMGDVKLMALIGATLGWQGVFGTVLISSIAGSLVGGALLVLRRGNLRTAVPYGPFLALGAFIMLFWGDLIIAVLYPGM